MKYRILIVEDEAVLAMMYKLGLENDKCTVVGVAHTGASAIEKAGETLPDLVLMDIKLRGAMDGVDAAIEIRKRYGTPIVYVTGNTDEHTRQRAIETDPLRYLEKPIESDALCEIVTQVMA